MLARVITMVSVTLGRPGNQERTRRSLARTALRKSGSYRLNKSALILKTRLSGVIASMGKILFSLNVLTIQGAVAGTWMLSSKRKSLQKS